MLRRPPGEGNAASKVILALVILLVPWLVDAQQRLQHTQAIRPRYESPQEGGAQNPLHTVEATRIDDKSQILETPLTHHRRKNTMSIVNGNAKDNHDASAIATLAPADPVVRAPPARRSSESAGLSSPQIARNLEDWEVEDFVLLATVDGKLYARDRKTGKEKWTLEVDKPVLESTHYRRNRSSLEEDYRPMDDYIWIVEPSRDGSLFIYIPGGPQGGLVPTGLTMKKLVEEMAPYADEEPPVVYTGEKRTTMITLDARTGRVLKWFGPGGALVNEDTSCMRPNGILDPDDDECSSSGTLTLGRTEYTIDIQSKFGPSIATLKYSEWGPNNFDSDLHRQYQATMDGKYVDSSYDGSIFAYDRTKDHERRLFKQKFDSPVIRVFDVARPWGTENNSPELVVLPQPVSPINDETLEIRNSRIFLNHTEDGSWYAMSGSSYPLITQGPRQAMCDTNEWWQHGPIWDTLDDSQLSEALVGLHKVNGARGEQLLTISGPSYSSQDLPNDSLTADLPVPPMQSPTVGEIFKKLPSSAADVISDFIYNPLLTVIMVILLLVYNKDVLRWAKAMYHKQAKSGLIDVSITSQPPPSAVLSEPTELTTIVEPQTESMDVVVLAEAAIADELSEEKLAEIDDHVPAVTDVTQSPALLAVKDGEKKEKKTHRGKRGGVKHRKGRQASEDTPPAKPPLSVEDAVRDAQKLGDQKAVIEPDVQTLPNGVAEISGPVLRLNSLEVNTERLIGTGSNGTMVFEGKFDGRDVAVKRMLIQFFDIASQETKLLRESDDHPNVIRYYAQQQSAGFLYIALELCPASLAEVIEKPQLHRELAQAGERDLPNVLYQITNGLSHLHNLRIVHRDLKPQNILVGTSKDGRPRLLVSDFGLCKKLEGEQSSFRATTAHAAGTSGWRAPELLLDDDIRDGSMATIDASTHSGSGPLVSTDVMPNRRATRAIDIFSLGLVFFYVLTKGSHPFDCGDRYMREVNIRKGNYNLRLLEVLGDYSFEAKDLIGSMLEQEPKRRPSARQVMAHPFFWSAKKRLNFLCDVSDHFEKEVREPPSPALQELEWRAAEVCHADFLKALGKDFVDSLGKQRKYTGSRLLDLLRALRNKKNHYEDMPDKLKRDVGPLPEGYLSFWTRRFPNLLICCWNVVYDVQWDETDRFHEYYKPAGL